MRYFMRYFMTFTSCDLSNLSIAKINFVKFIMNYSNSQFLELSTAKFRFGKTSAPKISTL